MARNGGTFSRRRRTDALCDISPLSDTHQVHVLAVDDSLVDRKVIERLLKITSCKVTAVDSGWRALQFLGLDEDENSDVGIDGLKVDMIITDYCMPGMTGYELLKRIKGSSTFREVPVVIMSSENVVARIDRCLEEGAEDFIVKPVQLSDVKRLKDCMFGENRMEIEDRGINKRKLEEMSDLSFSPSPVSISPSVSPSPPFISPAASPPPSPPPISPSSSPSPPPFSSSLSPPSSISSSFSIPSFSPSPLSIYPTTSSIPQSLSSSPSPQPSTPCSPSLLDSPIMRLTVTNCD